MSFLIVFALLLQISLETVEKCVTLNNENGICKSLYYCPEMINLLIKSDTNSADYLQRSYCAKCKPTNDPMICCKHNKTINQKEVTLKPQIQNNSKTLSERRYCGYQHIDDYFHSENETGIDEFPWLAIFKYKRDEDIDQDVDDELVEFGCGGSLINARYVLTAAQCLRLRTASAVGVRLGEYNIRNEKDCVKYSNLDECSFPVQDLAIEKKIKHPGYNRKLGLNDIALVRLNETVLFTDYVRPICLPIPEIRLAQIGDTLVTTGFGRIARRDNYTVIKKKIIVTLITNEECEKQFEKIVTKTRNVNDNVICTHELNNTPTLSCEGDGGSPVMYQNRRQWHIEGITVWGSNICGDPFPWVHTKVVNYLDWIKKSITGW